MTERNILSSKENVDEGLKPPFPPRTAFICFSDSTKREIAQELGISERSKEILKHVADAWKELSSHDKADWDEAARSDKLRYVREKAAYKGSWDIPKRRAKKHPLAPKRPMSAFLKFSQSRRTDVKKENPDMSNTDVSRLLGEMWRNAPPREKAPYVDKEEIERAQYKIDIAKFKAGQARLDAASRTSHNLMKPAAPTYQNNAQEQDASDDEGIVKLRSHQRDENSTEPIQFHHHTSQMMYPTFMNSYSFNAESFDSSEILPEIYIPPRHPSYSSRQHSTGGENRVPTPPPESRAHRDYDDNLHHHYNRGYFNGRYH